MPEGTRGLDDDTDPTRVTRRARGSGIGTTGSADCASGGREPPKSLPASSPDEELPEWFSSLGDEQLDNEITRLLDY